MNKLNFQCQSLALIRIKTIIAYIIIFKQHENVTIKYKYINFYYILLNRTIWFNNKKYQFNKYLYANQSAKIYHQLCLLCLIITVKILLTNIY